MRQPLALVLPILALSALSPARAQGGGHAMPPMASDGADASMMPSMEKMSKDMAAVPMSGDADRDFVGMMIPHHQGAIDMARFELAHGKDPALRKLAQQIIDAQIKEIAEMRRWQSRHPVQQSAR